VKRRKGEGEGVAKQGHSSISLPQIEAFAPQPYLGLVGHQKEPFSLFNITKLHFIPLL